MPERLEELDELLAMVARPRVVGRDGIRFGGLRYLDSTLAAFVGERVTIRHDPRDVAEIRVYHRDRFLCRAINAEHADRTVSLRDVQAARRARRKALRTGINERIAAVPATPDARAESDAGPDPRPAPKRRPPRLKVYRED
jgi:putative transposase